ncbi:MAG: LuxR family transcriptional regulator [Pseudomonadota bacterium]
MKGSLLAQRVEDLIERIDRVSALDSVYDRVSEMRETFDVEHAVYFSSDQSKRPYALATYGSEWAKHYEENKLYHIDPIVGAAFTRFGLYDWKSVSWAGRQSQAFRSDAVAAGVGTQGVALPIRGPLGEFAMVTMSSNARDRSWSTQRTEFAPYLMLVGQYMHEATRTIVQTPDLGYKVLSPREKDVLLFLSKGMNRAHVAEKLKISEHTLRVYVDAARRKLNAQNTTHAVARALKLGMISF